jgi:protein transport protein SEC23
MISEKAIGNGGTTEWRVPNLLPTTTLAFFVDITASKADPIPLGRTAFMQFATRYRHVQSGKTRLRVTTHAVRFADMTNGAHAVASSFDQEAATVLLARLAMWKARDEDLLDVVHFIDRTLIRFCRKFGTYNKGDPSSFALSGNFSVFPQFLYHLRRSPFMSTFNSSPDLTTSLRHSLLLEDVASSLFMIQPTLMQFSLSDPPQPVLLDTASLNRGCVLLLDTFFRVLVWYGADIVAWREAGYHERPEYENLKVLLEAPVEEAKALIGERFPTPLLVCCDQDSSLSRYLLARCNPSTQNYDALGKSGENLGSDEPSYARFWQKLKEVAVND